MVPETVEAKDGKAIRTRVGHAIIKNKMKEHGAVMAGEHSAHYYFKDNFNADSGLIAAVASMDVLNKSGLKMSELADKYRKYINLPEANFEVEDKEEVMKKVERAFKDAEVDHLDGLTVRTTT